MSELRISADLLRELRAHGESTYPRECCGVLLGLPSSGGWTVLAVEQADNARTEDPAHHYEIAPSQLVQFERHAREQGLQIAGFYHSHPDHPPQWSQADFDGAHWIGCIYAITEVADGHAHETRAFMLQGNTEEDKRFELAEIHQIE